MREVTDEIKNVQKRKPPAPTASAIGPCPTLMQISRTPRQWKFTQHLPITQPPQSTLRYQFLDNGTRLCSYIPCLPSNTPVICINVFSPGVTVTELQRRGGLSEEAYEKVIIFDWVPYSG